MRALSLFSYLSLPQHTRLHLLLCLIAGASTPLSLSPFDYWPVGILSISVLGVLLNNTSTGKQSLLYAYSFGLGYFGVGVSWVFVSIYYFSATPLPLAILMTILFIAFVALVFALPFYAISWLKASLRLLIGLPLLWVVSEWLRTWVLTGFPWLFMGYSQTDTWLSGWAPVGGVLLVSFWACLTSSTLSILIKRQYSLAIRTALSAMIAGIWLSGYGLSHISWTTATSHHAINVGIVQPNIPQDLRWTPEYQSIIRERLLTLSEPLWEQDWIIWPEGALPHLYHNSLDLVNLAREMAQRTDTSVISGALYDDLDANEPRTPYLNSIVTIGEEAEGIYHKQRLVPFGEYVPLENMLRGVIDFFNLPLSVITAGSSGQSHLTIGPYSLANAICYEIAYPALVATQAKQSHVLLTVSNDAWFGDSLGPIQHFQMVRMRALEIGRYIIRGTNNGLSAIITPDGTVKHATEQFISTQMRGKVIPMEGNTPYMLIKNGGILALLLFCAAFAYRKPSNIE